MHTENKQVVSRGDRVGKGKKYIKEIRATNFQLQNK